LTLFPIILKDAYTFPGGAPKINEQIEFLARAIFWLAPNKEIFES